jgi:hypothetical protein
VYSDKVNNLFSSQLPEWELARVNYSLLSKVRTKELDFGRFRIVVQFNPERMRSSAAKVDPKSIEARPCFLCSKNRPAEQRGVSIENDLTVLVNPFPIFRKHLTIPSEMHIGQRIKNSFEDMLNLAKGIPDFVIFYNGPQCGASAPDHLHFQAGNVGFLPIERDFLLGKFTRLISKKPGIDVLHWRNYLRGIITFKGSDKVKLIDAFITFYNKFSEIQPDLPEPMLNILAYFFTDGWVVHLIPRKLHRPSQFFARGNDQILLSPASVDIGGVIITPREEDFNKISKSDVEDIFNQVCFDDKETDRFFSELI